MNRRTSIATAILSLLTVGTLVGPAAATVVPTWSISHTQAPDGAYEFQSYADPVGYLSGPDPAHRVMRVYVNNLWLDDNLTLDKDLEQVFVPGDGSPGVAFPPYPPGREGGILVYAYTAAGTYHPHVELTDGDGNTTMLYPGTYSSGAPASVTVLRDDIPPSVNLKRPAQPHRIASWRVLRGSAADDDSGIDQQILRVLEKRDDRWYVYDFSSRRWYAGRAGYAWSLQHLKSHYGIPYPPAGWTAAVRGLTQGRLVVLLQATDSAGNTASTPVTDVTLTRR